MAQIEPFGTVHSVLGFRPFTPSLPHFTQLSWTPTSTPMARATASPSTLRYTLPTPLRGLPMPSQSGSTAGGPADGAGATVMLVLLPILFGGLTLVAIAVGFWQWHTQRQKEKERQSGMRAARLRRASSPFAPIPMANVNPDLEAGMASREQDPLHVSKSAEAADGRLSRANSARSYNLPRKPPPPYHP
ncbi:hypothetical protein JCM10908_003466 [Rhodotorula pacifica]|uniref:uncharacterized protein n=1 Tax=Rhodotorula pacifica TaxID=1495444 RepID=UPI00317D63EC